MNASTSRWTIVRQPLCAAVGKTHASSVIAVLKLSEAEGLITTRSLVPSKVSAEPYFPAAVQVGPKIVPVFPLPEASRTVVPAPSLNAYAATGPDVCARALNPARLESQKKISAPSRKRRCPAAPQACLVMLRPRRSYLDGY